MNGFRKGTLGGACASMALLALSTGVLASPAPAQSNAADNSGCQASGNQLIESPHFTIGSGTFSSLSGHVSSGDQVVVTFTVPARCSVEASLVSYQAPSATFDSTTASQQTVSDFQDETLDAGEHSLTVTVPGCYFQVDFVRGPVIQQLGPNGSNNFYGSQGRLISAANGGSTVCPSATPTPTPAPTSTPTPVATPTPAPTSTPSPVATPTSTPSPVATATPTATATPIAAATTHDAPPAGGVLAASTSVPTTGAGLGFNTQAAMIVIVLGFILLAVSRIIRRDDLI